MRDRGRGGAGERAGRGGGGGLDTDPYIYIYMYIYTYYVDNFICSRALPVLDIYTFAPPLVSETNLCPVSAMPAPCGLSRQEAYWLHHVEFENAVLVHPDAAGARLASWLFLLTHVAVF